MNLLKKCADVYKKYVHSTKIIINNGKLLPVFADKVVKNKFL